jgi:RNA polymerase sigma-70 factor (ECF subfamily)
MDQLPSRQKACFVLFAVEGLPQDEIAGILGLSLGGVKSNIYHAKKKLRHVLTEEV